MKRLIYLTAMLLTAAGSYAQELQRDTKLVCGKLDNGLTYYIYPNDNPKGEAVYRLFVKAGSVMENDNQQGLAHFLEHIAFNGTIHFPDDGIVRFLERKGAKFGKDLNAHTSFTETVYKLQLPSRDATLVDSAMTILSDWADGMCIDSIQVEKERGVILSEWLQRGGVETDNNMQLIHELFNGSKYASRITIGDTAIIRHTPAQVLRDYYETWYVPSLMAVAVTGDIDAKQIEKLVREKFSNLNTPMVKPAWKQVMIPTYKREKAIIYTNQKVKKTELDIIQLMPLTSPVKTAFEYKEYLNRALINSLFKLRFNALSFDNPAYDKGSVQYSPFLNAATVADASVELVKGKMRQGIRDFILHERQIIKYGFTRAEINRAGKSLLNSMKNKAQSAQPPLSSDLMSDIYSDYYNGNTFISRQQEYELVKRFLPEIDSASIVKTLRNMFVKPKSHYLLRGGDDVRHEIVDEKELMALIREVRKMPVTRYNRHIDIPDELCNVEAKTHIVSEQVIDDIHAVDIRLDNGVRVIFKQSDLDRDKILLSGFRKGGQYGIDSLRYYTALVAPSVIALSGAGNFTRDALNYFLAGNTASIRFLVDKLRSGVAGSAHLADMETMFQLLYLKWTQPKLDTAVYKMSIDKIIEDFQQKEKTPADIFAKQLEWLLNGRNYTNVNLTDTIIQTMVKEQDALPLFQQFYGSGSGYTFVIIGDCSIDRIRPLIETYIGALPQGNADTTWVLNRRQIPHDSRQLVSYTGDSQKASVSLIYQQDKPFDDDRTRDIKSDIMKSILRSVLLNRLREEMGKVYSVSVAASATPYPSFLSRTMIAFTCLPQDVDTLIVTVNKELQRLYHHPESFQTYLDDVKKFLIKDHALQVQNTSYWTSQIRNAVYYGHEEWNWVSDYEKTVNALTINDISEFAATAILRAQFVKGVLYPKK